MIPLVAAENLWQWAAPIMTALGALIGGAGVLWAQRNGTKTLKIDYNNNLLEKMQEMLAYMSKENESLRGRVDALTTQVQTCQNDKYEMQRQLRDWERKWEDKLSGTT